MIDKHIKKWGGGQKFTDMSTSIRFFLRLSLVIIIKIIYIRISYFRKAETYYYY